MHRLPLLASLALMLQLAACGGVPEELTFQVRAAPDINPDGAGEAKPTLVRLYLLSSPTRLRNADYFTLEDRERDTLAGDLVLRREITIRPGETQRVRVAVPPDTRDVAAVAGFRELDQATWMATRPVPSNGRVPVVLQGRTVTLPKRMPPENEPVKAPFQLPSMPSMPSMPSLPSLPSMPSLPSLPSLPSMPSLPQVPSSAPLSLPFTGT